MGEGGGFDEEGNFAGRVAFERRYFFSVCGEGDIKFLGGTNALGVGGGESVRDGRGRKGARGSKGRGYSKACGEDGCWYFHD